MPKHSNKNDLQHLYRHQQQAIALEHQMALSKNETIFLSSAGDVVICRCRKSHQPQHLHSSTETKSIVSANTVCCEMESVTGEAQQSSFCAPWGSSPSPPSEPATYNIPNPRRSRKSQGGLLGGSPASVAAAPVQAHSMQTYHKNKKPRVNTKKLLKKHKNTKKIKAKPKIR